MEEPFAPKEPVDIKHVAKEKADSGEWAFQERDKTIHMFATGASFLPKYLWREWKPALKSRNISWQLFLKVVSACDRDVVDWVEGEESWKELVSIINKVLRKAEKGIYPLWPP